MKLFFKVFLGVFEFLSLGDEDDEEANGRR